MTAVVTFNHQNQPYIISDVLLTGPEDANKKQSVPTIRDVTEIFPRGTGWTVVGLCQKTVIIDGYLAIGFSGQVIVAITLLKEIKEQSTIKRFNSTSIKIFINEFVKAHPSHNEIDLVGCIIDDECSYYFGYNDKKSNNINSIYDYTSSIGSGGDILSKRIDHIKKSVVLLKSIDIKPSTYPIIPTAVLIDLYTEDLMTTAPLLNYYGRGWEITWVNSNKKFVKLNDITLIFWHTPENSNLKEPKPAVILKYHYYNELLGIRRVLYDEFFSVEDTMFFIDSPLKILSKEEKLSLKIPSINSSTMINLFLKRENKKTICRSLILCGKNAKDIIQFEENNDKGVSYKINHKILESYIETA